jgi:hypothetical protein
VEEPVAVTLAHDLEGVRVVRRQEDGVPFRDHAVCHREERCVRRAVDRALVIRAADVYPDGSGRQMSFLEGRNPGGYLGMGARKPSHDTPQLITRQSFLCRVERIPGAHDNPRIGSHRHASVPVGAALSWMEMANVVVPRHDELPLPIHRRRVGHPLGVVVE